MLFKRLFLVVLAVLFSLMLVVPVGKYQQEVKEPDLQKSFPSAHPPFTISSSTFTIATVNAEQITLMEFDWRLTLSTGYSLENYPAGKIAVSAVKRHFLDELIIKKLLLQEAACLGYILEELEYQEGIGLLVKDYAQESLKNKIRELEQDEHWSQAMREEFLIKKLVKREVDQKVLVKKTELLKYYRRFPGEFTKPEKIHVWQVMFHDEAEAKKMKHSFDKKKVSFKKVALKQMESESGLISGDLGFIQRSQMPKAFEKIAFSLPLGKISPLVKTEYGYHLIKVIKKKAPEKISFYAAKPIILNKLMKQKANAAYQEWIKGLKKRSTIRIDVNFFNL